MISRTRITRSYMPTMYQVGAAGTSDCKCLRDIRTGLQGLTGSGHQIEHAYEVTGQGCRISRVRTHRFNIPSRYQVGAAGSHGFGTPNRTWLRGIRSGCRISRVRNTNRTCLRGIRTGCRISQVWNNSSNMHTRYQDGVAGSHG